MAALRIRWLRRAEASLAEAAEFIARDNPRAAHEFIRRIRESAEEIAAHPARGRPGRVNGTREFAVSGTAYLIPYRVRGEDLEILHVLHGARRWPRAFRR